MPNILEAFLSKSLLRKEFSVDELTEKWSRLKATYCECSDSVVDDDQQVFDGISRILEERCKSGVPEAGQCCNGDTWSKSMNYELVVEQLAYVENKTQLSAIMNFLNSMLSVSQQRILLKDLRDKKNSINDKKTNNKMIFKNCKISNVAQGDINYYNTPRETVETKVSANVSKKKTEKYILATDQDKQDAVITRFKAMIEGKKGTDAFFIYEAFIYAGLILPATHSQFVNTVGKDVLGKTEYYRLMAIQEDPKEELKAFAENIKI